MSLLDDQLLNKAFDYTTISKLYAGKKTLKKNQHQVRTLMRQMGRPDRISSAGVIDDFPFTCSAFFSPVKICNLFDKHLELTGQNKLLVQTLSNRDGEGGASQGRFIEAEMSGQSAKCLYDQTFFRQKILSKFHMFFVWEQLSN